MEERLERHYAPDRDRWVVRWRQAGKHRSRRGFTSRRAAVIARRHMIESIERGEIKVGRTTFGAFWTELLEERRPYSTAGSCVETDLHGRKRLIPMLADVPLLAVDIDEGFGTFITLNKDSRLAHARAVRDGKGDSRADPR
ncbi:MAG: hypothetical protein QOF17_738 [Solirubrobacteraceae bacterium]|jgi:hypothetical protein|nr:hypothetical protein [Solirubrobacteraceae bacterium]